MRSCHVCFFARFANTHDPEGECMFEPPTVHVTEIPDDRHSGGVQIMTSSVRPLVGRSDYCGRFRHRNTETERGAEGTGSVRRFEKP